VGGTLRRECRTCEEERRYRGRVGIVGNGRGGAPFIGRMAGEEAIREVVRCSWMPEKREAGSIFS
jgi:hypothetical protein